MRDADPDGGGFEHNLQSLRVVDQLEARYPDFDGLNLSFETREGILKHCSRAHARRLATLEPGGPAQRFIEGTQPSLEAQVVNLADELAYNAHDIDDGVRSGLLTLEQLDALPLFAHWRAQVLQEHPRLAAQPGRRALRDAAAHALGPDERPGVRHAGGHPPARSHRQRCRRCAPAGAAGALQRCSSARRRSSASCCRALYRHPQVVQTTDLRRTVVAELFQAYRDAPEEMPADYAAGEDRPRAVADYIAGMTDRFALREHQRLTGRRLFGN